MDGALYPRIHPSCKMGHPAGGLRLWSRHPQQAFGNCHPPGFPQSDRPDTGLFSQLNQPDDHHVPIDGPLRPPISQPIHEVSENQPKFPSVCLKLQEPVLEQDRY